jgi:predicted site-specific integrase-resolvase
MSAQNKTGPWRVKDYCDYRHVSKPTVYGWFAKGWLNSIKVGGCRFILPEHDAAFIDLFNGKQGVPHDQA